MYVCICKGITESQIIDVMNSGASSMRDVRNQLGVNNQCGKCLRHTRAIVESYLSSVTNDHSNQWYELA